MRSVNCRQLVMINRPLATHFAPLTTHFTPLTTHFAPQKRRIVDYVVVESGMVGNIIDILPSVPAGNFGRAMSLCSLILGFMYRHLCANPGGILRHLNERERPRALKFVEFSTTTLIIGSHFGLITGNMGFIIPGLLLLGFSTKFTNSTESGGNGALLIFSGVMLFYCSIVSSTQEKLRDIRSEIRGS